MQNDVPGGAGCEAEAKAFVLKHHYSATHPAARLRVGILVKRPFRPEFLGGVAVFCASMSNAVVRKWLGVSSAAEGVEVGRCVLLDAPSLAANAESFVLSRSLRLLRQALPEVRGVVSFVDRVERRDESGNLVKRGHTGVALRAASAELVGRSSPRKDLMMPTGHVFSPRAVSKVRNEESGAAYCLRHLTVHGAPSRVSGESGAAYRERLQRERFLRPVCHPRQHRLSLDGLGSEQALTKDRSDWGRRETRAFGRVGSQPA